MKKSIFYLPLIAIWLLAGSCDYSDNYDPSPAIDTEEITQAVNAALQEAFNNAGFNDTIFNCDDESGAVTSFTGDSILTVSRIAQIPEIKVKIISNEPMLQYDLKREKNEQRKTIAIVSVIFPCLMITVIVGLVLLFFYARLRNRNKVIEAAINANYQLPPEFYTSSTLHATPSPEPKAATDGTVPPPMPRNERFRNSGIRLTAIGLGIMIMLGVWGGLDAAVIGIIPLLIGCAYLANYYNLLK